MPLLEDAKAGRITEPMDRIPCAYNFADGMYVPYRTPDVGDAYARFSVEMEGGLTERDKQRQARMQALWDSKHGRME